MYLFFYLSDTYLRRITGLWRRTDGTLYPLQSLFQASGVHSLPDILDSARLTRLGHVARIPDESVVKQLLCAEGLTGAQVPRGRPRTTWLGTALSSLQHRTGEVGWNWYTMAQDRVAWRRICTSLP